MQHTVHSRVQVYFPVFLEGANLSMGDMHFSQGDGEVSLCSSLAVRVTCHPGQEACSVSQCMPLLPSRGAHKLGCLCKTAWRASRVACTGLPLPVTPLGLPAAEDICLFCTAHSSSWLYWSPVSHPVQVSFCGGIEMSGFLHLKAEILRGGMEQYLTPMGPK